MTRKDYVLIAKAIKDEVDTFGVSSPRRDGAAQVVYGLSDVLKQNNARFNREQFITACGFPYRKPPGNLPCGCFDECGC